MAVFYLTDNTRQEKELIFSLLEKYYQSMEKSGIEKILSVVYPDLCAYIRDYRYNIPLLDRYFSLYTYSKIINKVVPELEEIVEKQAVLREYNLLLEPRTVKMDEIDKTASQLYFMDAMGVEYLSYILALQSVAPICLPLQAKTRSLLQSLKCGGLWLIRLRNWMKSNIMVSAITITGKRSSRSI